MIPLGSQRPGARGVNGRLAPSFPASQQPDAQLSQLWPWMVQWQPSPSLPPLPFPLPSLHLALESISNSSGHHCLQFLGQAQHRCQLLFHSPSFHFHSSAPAKPPIRVMPTRGGCGWMCACPPASPRARLQAHVPVCRCLQEATREISSTKTVCLREGGIAQQTSEAIKMSFP